jgi:hypothetical protein
MKKYSFTKQESDRLGAILQVAQIQEEMFNAITDRYRSYLLVVFKRCGIEPEMLQFANINLATGELTIDKPEPKKEEKKTEKVPDKK